MLGNGEVADSRVQDRTELNVDGHQPCLFSPEGWLSMLHLSQPQHVHSPGVTLQSLSHDIQSNQTFVSCGGCERDEKSHKGKRRVCISASHH